MNVLRTSLTLLAMLGVSQAADAQLIHAKVAATAVIYAAGQKNVGNTGGTRPPGIMLPAGIQCVSIKRVRGSLPCAAAAGCITLDQNEPEGTHLNDPNGIGAYPPTSSNTGANGISGIVAPYAGYLVGVFVPPGGPSGATPAALNFTAPNRTSFKKLKPLLDQSFFVGSGYTEDATGTRHKFTVPSGAAALYLGISDASGFNGSPGAYYDNVGYFQVIVQLHAVGCEAE